MRSPFTYIQLLDIGLFIDNDAFFLKGKRAMSPKNKRRGLFGKVALP